MAVEKGPLTVDVAERVENLERVVVELSGQLERVQEKHSRALAQPRPITPLGVAGSEEPAPI